MKRTIGLLNVVLILALLFRDSAGLSSGGRGFLAFVAYAIATFVVWLLYDFTQQYMTPVMFAVGVALSIAALAPYAAPLARVGADSVFAGWAGVDIGPLVEQGVVGVGHRDRRRDEACHRLHAGSLRRRQLRDRRCRRWWRWR
mgnify:CR=1 FL=1